ncbi:MAG: hypothetical protein CMJ46_10850, partial [Planctomyces sp.]|nr:hypothetical protein [Planctomyces sp.]
MPRQKEQSRSSAHESVATMEPSHSARSTATEEETFRRVNTRLIVMTGITIPVLLVVVHFVHGFQVDRQAQSLLSRAAAAEEAGDTNQARELLAQYIGFQPRDTSALLRYTRLLNESASNARQRLQVFLLFEQVVRRDPVLA